MSVDAEGAGSRRASGPPDQLTVRQIYKLGRKALPFVRAASPDLRFAGRVGRWALLLAPVGIWISLTGADLFLNALLNGDPISETQATLLFVDPAAFVDVDKLAPAARRLLRDRLVFSTALLTLIAIPFGVGLTIWVTRVLQRMNQAMRVQLLGQVQQLSLRFHSDSQIGDAVYRMYQDSAMGTNLMGVLFLGPIGLLWNLALGLGVLVFFSPALAGVLLALLIPLVYVTLRLSPWLREGFRAARETNSQVTSTIQETLSAIRIIKAYGGEDVQQRRFEGASREAFRAANVARTRMALFALLMVFVGTAGLIFVEARMALFAHYRDPIALGGVGLFVFSAWNYGAFVAGRGRASRGSRASEGFAKQWIRAQDMAVGMDRFFELLSAEPEVTDSPDALPMGPLQDGVRFRGVGFAYQPDRPVLCDVDLTVRAGSVTAIVGPTGSGKSTLVSLLLRLFDPDEGAIEIDGVDLRKITLESLRANVSIALQQILLFGTSVRENIRYSVEEADDTRVRDAARVACADDFIEALPGGYDTPLGERGARLSTGQRQRLGIARAVIKDAPILILDEPTAALDAATEAQVMEQLAVWGRGRAIFLVTHRLSTIRRADQIVYMRDGRIVEQGSHESLMARPGGAYRAFVELEDLSTGEFSQPAQQEVTV